MLSSSITHNVTKLQVDLAVNGNGNCMYRVGKVQSIFISGQLKVISLFRYSLLLYSAFYRLPVSSEGRATAKL